MTLQPLDSLMENFALFDDWEGRYQYLIDLGAAVPPMPDALKTEQTEVKGCVSRVWLHQTRNAAGQYHFMADSDGKITKGLVYVVLCAFEGKRAEEIAGVDIESAFERLGLAENLSPNRRNGFFAMVEKIRALSL
jgi:cysteine desulfuration protein SufE